MISALYQALVNIGYTHPLHPAVTHIPLGLVIGGFIFALTGTILKRPSLAKSARHCFWLALLVLPVAVLFGLMDWQHFYDGAWSGPFITKMVLAVLLPLLLLAAIRSNTGGRDNFRLSVVLYALCLLTAIGLGFTGGEVQYG